MYGNADKLGILWISVCSFWLCGSIVANPIIYRLVPSLSRYEIRQKPKQRSTDLAVLYRLTILFSWYVLRPANSHGSAVSLTIFLSFLTVSRQDSSISRVLGKIIVKWLFKLLNQNKNGKLTRNACAMKWKTNKEEHCSYFFVPSSDFRLCSINLIGRKGSVPWERGLIPRRLPCWVSQ